MHKKVRVGIATHNRAELLPKAIQSAQQQEYPVLEFAVIDDGSTDNTQVLSQQYPHVIWSRHERPLGYLISRNELMRDTDAEYFVSLDDDAWFVQRDEIRLAVEYMEKNPEAGAVAFDIVSPDKPELKPRSQPVPVNTFIGCGHLLRLSLVRALGFYQQNPGYYGSEEKDLSLRMLDRDYAVIAMPGVHVWHDKTPVARDLPVQHASGVCNDLAFTLRRFPVSMLLFFLPAKICSHLLFSLRNHLLLPCLKGILRFFMHFCSIYRSRAPVSARAIREFRTRARIAP